MQLNEKDYPPNVWKAIELMAEGLVKLMDVKGYNFIPENAQVEFNEEEMMAELTIIYKMER